jgi:tRNA modification GTPase
MDKVVEAITGKADALQRETGDETIAINARHAHVLEEARSGLLTAREKLDAESPVELVASDLRSVLAAYGEIVGKVDNERMLDHLFATFCIGK